MNVLKQEEFNSKTRAALDHNDGLPLDFVFQLMGRMTHHSIGMDLSEVNFQITKSKNQLKCDEQTLR